MSSVTLYFNALMDIFKCFWQGILVFASVMATLGLQIILESLRTLIYDVSIVSTNCYVLYFLVGLLAFNNQITLS